MKRLTFFVVILALIYSGYWLVGSSAVESGAKTRLEEMATDGWDVSYGDLATSGFPSRFDTTVTDLEIATPDRSLRFEASVIQALALSYLPTSAILVFPSTQIVTVDDVPVTFQSDGLRASVSANTNTALSLDQVTAEAKSIAAVLGPDAQISSSNFLAALRESSLMPNAYDTYFNLNDTTVSDAILAQTDPQGVLPRAFETVTIDGTVTLDRPLNRHTLPQWERDPGKLRGLTLRTLLLNAGPFRLSGEGAFTVAADGTPDGTITLTLNDWQGMLNAAQSAGVLPAQYQFMAQSMGQTLSGGATELVLPITVQNGNLSVGPLPLGPAPKFP